MGGPHDGRQGARPLVGRGLLRHRSRRNRDDPGKGRGAWHFGAIRRPSRSTLAAASAASARRSRTTSLPSMASTSHPRCSTRHGASTTTRARSAIASIPNPTCACSRTAPSTSSIRRWCCNTWRRKMRCATSRSSAECCRLAGSRSSSCPRTRPQRTRRRMRCAPQRADPSRSHSAGRASVLPPRTECFGRAHASRSKSRLRTSAIRPGPASAARTTRWRWWSAGATSTPGAGRCPRMRRARPCRTTCGPEKRCALFTSMLAPRRSGAHLLQLDVLQEDVAWFGECGSQAAEIGIVVEGGDDGGSGGDKRADAERRPPLRVSHPALQSSSSATRCAASRRRTSPEPRTSCRSGATPVGGARRRGRSWKCTTCRARRLRRWLQAAAHACWRRHARARGRPAQPTLLGHEVSATATVAEPPSANQRMPSSTMSSSRFVPDGGRGMLTTSATSAPGSTFRGRLARK